MSRKLAVLVSLAVACGGSSKKPQPPVAQPAEPAVPDEPLAVPDPALPAIPSTPAAAPDGLLATASIGDPAAVVAAIAGYADRINPGAGAMLTLDTLADGLRGEGIDLRGADLAKPVRVLVLDPMQFKPPLVVVVGVADHDALVTEASARDLRVQVHGGYAAIGSFDALSAAGGYALTTLAATPAPAMPIAEVRVTAAMKRFGPMFAMGIQQIAAAADPAQRPMMEASLQMYLALLEQIDRMTVTLELDGDHASVLMGMHPLPGTTFASFVGQQRPATFALLERLPGGVSAMGGRVDLDLVWHALHPIMESTMAMTYGAPGGKELMAFWQRWMALETGEHALSFDVAAAKFQMSMLWDVARPADAVAMWRDYLSAMGKAAPSRFAFKAGSAKHRGATITTLTVTPGKDLSADERMVYDRFGGNLLAGIGAADKHVVFTMGSDAVKQAKALLDLLRAKPAPSPLAPVIAEAKRRGESYLVAVDVPGVASRFASMLGNGPGPSPTAGEPSVFAIGTAGGALVWRFTMPASQAQALARM